MLSLINLITHTASVEFAKPASGEYKIHTITTNEHFIPANLEYVTLEDNIYNCAKPL